MTLETSSDPTAHLAMQFIEHIANSRDDCDGREEAFRMLGIARHRLRLGSSLDNSQDGSDSLSLARTVITGSTVGSDAVCASLQHHIAQFAASAESAVGRGTDRVFDRADASMLKACVALLADRMRAAEVSEGSQTRHDSCGDLLTAALDAYHEMSNEAAQTGQMLVATKTLLSTSREQNSQIVADFDRARRFWRTELDRRAMAIEARDAHINAQEEEVQSLRSHLTILSRRLDQAHEALGTVYAPIIAQTVGFVGAWMSNEGLM